LQLVHTRARLARAQRAAGLRAVPSNLRLQECSRCPHPKPSRLPAPPGALRSAAGGAGMSWAGFFPCGEAQGGMSDFTQSIGSAVSLIVGGDAELLGIVALSLRVSLTASIIALLIG